MKDRRPGIFRLHLLLGFLYCFCAAAWPGYGADTISLSGSDWLIHAGTDRVQTGADPSDAELTRPGWIAARVPGNIQADLEAAHLLEPLSYGAGDPRLAEVARKNWWYRKDFAVPERFANQRLQLVFDGVDFAFDVWLNGRHLGHRAGQFRRFAFDVADAVRPGETNRLLVRIERMPLELDSYLTHADGAWSGQLIPPHHFASNDAPFFFVNGFVMMRRLLKDLKSATNFGWDWGVNIYTLGIWKDVRLEATGPARIDWVQVQTPLSPAYDSARIKVRLETDSLRRVRARARFRVTGQGVNLAGSAQQELSPGKGVIETEIALDKPALWWPNGQGSQPLYELHAELEDADSGSALDSHVVQFGVREIRWEQVEGAPADFINPYQLVVNGRPIRMMGSNLVPPDLLFGRIGDRAGRLLHLAHDAGMNTIRVWGGGVILPDDIYAMADRLGLMLSQEFPLANSWPETDPLFLRNLAVTTTGIIKQLRNHPSIIEWTGGNEMPWKQGTDHPAMHVLEQACAGNDTRIFRATDPIQGSRHSPWDYAPRTHYAHYNRVLETLPLAETSGEVNTMNAMRYGEFGTQTPAHLETLLRDVPPASRWPLEDLDDPVLIRKNIVQAVFASDFWLKKPTLEELFGPFDRLDSLVRAGQFLGAEGLRYAFDELRRKGKRIGGMTSWDFNETWSNGAGSFQVDYTGRPLMNYDFTKQALSPAALTLRYDSILFDPTAGVNAELWLTSDAPRTLRDLQWSWTARDRRGQVIAQDKGTASIDPREARALGDVKCKPPADTSLGPVFVELRLADSSGTLLTERLHIFGADNPWIWPFDGLLRNQGQDEGDSALLRARPQAIRVLFIHDHDDKLYQDLGWTLRRFGVRSDFVPATEEAVAKVAPDAATLRKNYDLVWIGDGDFEKQQRLAARLGPENLQRIAQAVQQGMGVALEGGWGAYDASGIETGALADMLPVTSFSRDGQPWQGTSGIQVAQTSPVVEGRLFSRPPKVTAYNLIRAKEQSSVWLRTGRDDDLLVAGAYGKGRVVAFASTVVGNWAGQLRQWSGYPSFVSRMFAWLAGRSDQQISAIDLPTPENRVTRPVSRTKLEVSAAPVRIENGEESFALQLKNLGEMTALFCEPRPVIEYRTDLRITNNYAFVPPGETRTITIAAKAEPGARLGLSQEGWDVACWNTGTVHLSPDPSVLLSVGRRDSMSQEFKGLDGPAAVWQSASSNAGPFQGARPDSRQIPLLMPGDGLKAPGDGEPPEVSFAFRANAEQVAAASHLRIHTADQDNEAGAVIEVTANGRTFEKQVAAGQGIQLTDPAHLAFPASVDFALPAGTWKPGDNTLQVRVKGRGWFTWDALVLTSGAAGQANLSPR